MLDSKPISQKPLALYLLERSRTRTSLVPVQGVPVLKKYSFQNSVLVCVKPLMTVRNYRRGCSSINPSRPCIPSSQLRRATEYPSCVVSRPSRPVLCSACSLNPCANRQTRHSRGAPRPGGAEAKAVRDIATTRRSFSGSLQPSEGPRQEF